MRHVSAWRNIRGHTMEYMQDKVEKYIKDNNITKKHFAEMICVTPSHLYSWLGGKQKFDKTLLKRVRSFLDGERNINNPYVVQKTVANKHRYSYRTNSGIRYSHDTITCSNCGKSWVDQEKKYCPRCRCELIYESE